MTIELETLDASMIHLVCGRSHGYLMSLDGEGNSEEPVYGPSLYKYDLTSGACKEHYLGQDVRGAEPVCAVCGDNGEDADWIMSLVHSEKTGKSKFVILDAQNFEAKPVATIELPFRVPMGHMEMDY